MKTTLVLFTVAISMLAADGPSREEQYRAKYGRYTPAYEARLQSERAATAPIELKNSIPDCCRTLQAGEKRANGGGNAILAEERNRVKYGRYSPAKEAAVKTEAAKIAIHGQKCRVLGQCPLPTEAPPAVAVVSNDDARLRAKFGRVFGVKEPRPAVSRTMPMESCEHACCQIDE